MHTACMTETQDASEAPVLVLQEGMPGTDTLELRITPSHADELVALLNSHHLKHSEVFEFSAGSDLIIYAVGGLSSLGGLTGLAKVLTAFFHQHDGKRLVFKVGDDEYSAEGCSLKQAERWVTRVLEQKAELVNTLKTPPPPR
jgi:hypothetical protein